MAKQKGPEAARSSGALARTVKFLGDVWREVHPRTGRVTWPSFKSVKVSTMVVIVSSILLGVYIALCDVVVRNVYYFIMGTSSTAS
jgi:preprotein translocase SecE subunit